MYLVDTNVLIRLFQPEDRHYESARKAVSILSEQRYALAIVPQVAAEFWNVCTRPIERNGLRKDGAETESRLKEVEASYKPVS